MMKRLISLMAACIYIMQPAIGQTTLIDSFKVDGVYRSYRLYVPASFAQATRPLVLNMHGLGSNALEQQYYGNFMPIADTAGFYVCMPQGTSYSGSTFWNVGFPGTPNVDDVKFLSQLIDTLAQKYPVDKSRVYATGMSNGGYMSHLLGIQLNNKIAAIASVAGSIVPNLYATAAPGRAVPVMEVHGNADGTVPYDGFAYGMPVDSVVQFWLRNNGCNTTPVQSIVPNTITSDGCTADHFVWNGGRNGTTVELFRINGGGHTWPGAVVNIGVTNQDFSASQEIWRFFRQYSLQTTTAISGAQSIGLKLQISPNPARNTLLIEAAGNGVTTVCDAAGRVVLQSTQKMLDISALPTGYFMLEYQDGSAKGAASFIKE